MLLASILLLTIVIAITTALLGSFAFQNLTPSSNIVLSPLEEKCQHIANEGYRIHSIYPDSTPDDLPLEERNRMLSLDEIWMKECVSVLPGDSIIRIADNVERNVSFGE